MIPIIFGINKPYILQAFVVMHSILKHSREGYHFIILTQDEIKNEVNRLAELLYQSYTNFSVSIKNIDHDLFCDIKIFSPHITQASFYRLLIPELVTGYDKCIYLDSDILVDGNLQELFDIELGNNYLAGVKDCHIFTDGLTMTRHQMDLGIPSLKNYINAGVLLMDLKKMREDGVVIRFLKQAKKENRFEDQDVLNFCCYDFIKILPIKFNLFHFYKGRTFRHLFDRPYDKNDYLFNWDKPYILHMGGENKPWLSKRYKGSDEWWRLAEIYRDSKSYKQYQDIYIKDEGDVNAIKRVFQACQEGKKVILWGFTEQGKDVCDIFMKKCIDVYAFCDNDVEKIGKEYDKIPVKDISTLIQMKEDIIWIITCKKAYREVFDQLSSLGVRSEDMAHFAYNSRSKTYYLSLHPQYYDEEIKTIALCENDKRKMSNEQYLHHIRRLIVEDDIGDQEYRFLYFKYRFDLWLKC